MAWILIQPDCGMLLTLLSALQPMQARDALRVLVVDDDSLVRWALDCMLIQHGCAVVEAEDGASATRAAADPSKAFDVILLDYRLPDAHGFELLTTLKQLAPQSRVLMMSSDMSADDLAEAVRRGASAFVPKPFDLDDVWTLIRESSVTQQQFRCGEFPAGGNGPAVQTRTPNDA